VGHPFARGNRIAIAVATWCRSALRLAFRCRRAFDCLSARPQMVTGLGHQRRAVGRRRYPAIFIAMNWGFGVTLVGASTIYLLG
jgi:hypothetical protein